MSIDVSYLGYDLGYVLGSRVSRLAARGLLPTPNTLPLAVKVTAVIYAYERIGVYPSVSSPLRQYRRCYNNRLAYFRIFPERAQYVRPWHLSAPDWTPPYVPRARHRGRARRHRWCQRALAGSPGVVGRSAVAVFVARCRVFLETRGKHEWALPGLLVWGWM